jgi:AcrR family transcriptional regulator
MSTPASKIEQKRLATDDWELAALDMMTEGGINAVAVEPLARRLGVTKGSFYWHFANRKALIAAALERWEAEDRAELLKHMGNGDEPREGLRQLFLSSAKNYRSHALFHALSQSREHALVTPVLQRVTRRRMELLTNAFEQLGLEREQARHRARLTYAAYTGYVQLAFLHHSQAGKGDEFDAYIHHTIDTLIP